MGGFGIAQRQFNGTFEMVPHLHSVEQVGEHPDWKIWEHLLALSTAMKLSGVHSLSSRE
jgi:hypothetical protein